MIALLNFTKSLQGSCVYILYKHEIVMAYSPSEDKMNQIMHCDWLPKRAR